MTELPPVLSLVTPCFNNLNYTKDCVDSVLRRPPSVPWEWILVNNGSQDGTREYLNSLAATDPTHFKVVHHGDNLGFCAGTNAGLRLTRGHPLWLNNDTIICQDRFFDQLLGVLNHFPQVGAVGPTSNYVMGPQAIREHYRYNMRSVHPSRYLIGFCFLIRREAFQKVGMVDEVFQNYGCDDLDYSIRLVDEGWELAINREAFLYHHPSMTNSQLPDYQKRCDFGTEMLRRKWGQVRFEKTYLPIGLGGARVLFAVPSWSGVDSIAYANHMGALWELMQNSKDAGYDVYPRVMPRSETCRARCEIADQAMKEEFSHLFFLDDDMLFNGHMNLPRLMAHNRPIVSGLCHLRTPPYYPSMFMDAGDKNGEVRYITDWPDGAFLEVDAVGMACCLIEVAALKHVKKDIANKGEKRALFSTGPARRGEKSVGEDIYFCKLARDAGVQVFVDTSVKFQHLGMPTFLDENQFRAIRDATRARGEPFAGWAHPGFYPQDHLAGRNDLKDYKLPPGMVTEPPNPEPQQSKTMLVHAGSGR